MQTPIFAFPFFGGGLGPMELMIVAGIALLLFGKRLPEVARSLGKGIVEFKKGVRGIEDEVSGAVYESPGSHARPPVDEEEQENVTAPKFEPPKFEPTEKSEPAEKSEELS